MIRLETNSIKSPNTNNCTNIQKLPKHNIRLYTEKNFTHCFGRPRGETPFFITFITTLIHMIPGIHRSIMTAIHFPSRLYPFIRSIVRPLPLTQLSRETKAKPRHHTLLHTHCLPNNPIPSLHHKAFTDQPFSFQPLSTPVPSSSLLNL